MTSLHHLLGMLDPQDDGERPAKLRTGTITDVGPPVRVRVGGNVVGCALLAGANISVGDEVVILTRPDCALVLGRADGGDVWLPLSGGTMSGDVDMDGNDVANVGEISGAVDGVNVSADGMTIGAPSFVGTSYYLRLGDTSSTRQGLLIVANSTATRTAQAYRNPNGTVGSIQTSASSTAYNTSSDERLKTAIGPLDDPLGIIDRLQVRRFRWRADDIEDVGLFAQEVAPHWPRAVTHGGNDPHEHPWSLDESKLVPLLIAGIQALSERVEQLESRCSPATD